jgi:hypothetical protein
VADSVGSPGGDDGGPGAALPSPPLEEAARVVSVERGAFLSVEPPRPGLPRVVAAAAPPPPARPRVRRLRRGLWMASSTCHGVSSLSGVA